MLENIRTVNRQRIYPDNNLIILIAALINSFKEGGHFSPGEDDLPTLLESPTNLFNWKYPFFNDIEVPGSVTVY